MYENNFSKNIDNNDYYVPQNFKPTYDNPYDARFVNFMPNNYYEDNVIPSYNRTVAQPYDYNSDNYNYINDSYLNYSNIPNYEMKNYIETNNVPNIDYTNDIEIEEDFINLYPDIYKKIVPIVDKVIKERRIKKVNNGILDVLTLEVYDEFDNSETKKVNTDNVTNINTNKNTSSTNTNTIARNSNNNIVSKTNSNINSNIKYETNKISNSVNTNINQNEKTIEVATRYRNIKNPTLRDLIRILILNRLFRNRYMPRPRRPRPYSNYSQTPFSTSNYNLVNRYEPNYNPMQEIDYTRSYFNSPYPEEN